MIKIVPFKAIDWFMDDPLELIDTPDNVGELLENRAVGISVYTEEGCIGCGGVILWDEYNSEAWIRISRKGLKHMKSGIKAIKDGFNIIAQNQQDTKIFCWVNIDWPKAQRMASWLGFTKRSELRVLHGITYLLWEYENGNCVNDSRTSSISSRANTAG